MSRQATIDKLREMRLPKMAEAFLVQCEDPKMNEIPFEDRLGFLVDTEFSSRRNNRKSRLIHLANFDQPQASIHDVNYTAGRKLDRNDIESLAQCNYITECRNIIILGSTGSGKSYLACAFGMEACKRDCKVKYIRLPELLIEMAMAKGDGTFTKLLKQYKKYQLLIIDEWLLISLKETEARDLLEIIHARTKKSSTIFCSQFNTQGWHTKFPEAPIAEAILDRIIYNSHIIEILYIDKEHDRSMREYYSFKNSNKS